jgi:hypothetical protein
MKLDERLLQSDLFADRDRASELSAEEAEHAYQVLRREEREVATPVAAEDVRGVMRRRGLLDRLPPQARQRLKDLDQFADGPGSALDPPRPGAPSVVDSAIDSGDLDEDDADELRALRRRRVPAWPGVSPGRIVRAWAQVMAEAAEGGDG